MINKKEVDLSEYEDICAAPRRLGTFLDDVYNRKRNHTSAGVLDPSGVRGSVEGETRRECVSARSNRPAVFESKSRGALDLSIFGPLREVV
jgi:hypothetical protein